MSNKILFVDDDPRILSAFSRGLRKRFDFHTSTDAAEALRRISEDGPFAVVISDQQMPGMKGIEFLQEVMDRDPMAIRIMLTGNADRETAVASVNESGVFRYLNKPCPVDTIAETIEAALIEYRRVAAEKELLEGTLVGSIKVLVDVLGANDPHAFRQISSIRAAGRRFADFTKLEKAWNLDMAITLSTIGDVMLPPHLRAKMIDGEPLCQDETDLVIQTPEVARNLLLNIPRMKDVADSIYYKDKGYEGSGFPNDEIKGNDIPLHARILKLLQFLVEQSENGVPDHQSFRALKDHLPSFDPKLVKDAMRCFVETAPREAREPCKLNVKVGNLLPGDKAATDIRTTTGELALASGSEINEAVIERLRQFHKMRPLVEPVCVIRMLKASEAGKQSAA